MTDSDGSTPPWVPTLYDEKHSFVWKLAADLIDLLDPEPNERILDIGCGTGHLTAQIADLAPDTLGVDNSTPMIERAKEAFPKIQFEQGDVHSLSFEEEFDAVFSNATLHWVTNENAAMVSISNALKPGGRFVAEFGGSENVKHLSKSIEAAFERVTGKSRPHQWYFPDIPQFAQLMKENQIETTGAWLIDRPTKLDGPTGISNWVRMFGQHWLKEVPPNQLDVFLDQVEIEAKEQLFQNGNWYADYRRIRITGVKNAK